MMREEEGIAMRGSIAALKADREDKEVLGKTLESSWNENPSCARIICIFIHKSAITRLAPGSLAEFG
jgi:hypothetical protein